MNNKGQALVEFVIIFPIMIFALLIIVDFGMISYDKNKLENIITDVGEMYKNNESEQEINKLVHDNDKDINYSILDKSKYVVIRLEKKYNYLTPGLDKIFKIKNITVEREIYNE